MMILLLFIFRYATKLINEKNFLFLEFLKVINFQYKSLIFLDNNFTK